MARGKAAEKGEILKRQMLALDWRIGGLSYRAIADKLSNAESTISHVQVYRDIENELERLAGLRADKAETLRELELQRLDKIINALDSWVASGNVGAVNAWIKASERRSKLLGLDAPTKHEVDWRETAEKAGFDAGDVSREFEELVKVAATKLARGSETQATD